MSELQICVSQGHYEKVILLLNQDINIKDRYGITCLMYASQNNDTKMMTILLDRGANMEACDMFNRTALIIAAMNYSIEASMLLLDRGADIHAMTHTGHSSIMKAYIMDRIEMVELLLSRGAEPVTDLLPEKAIHINNLMRRQCRSLYNRRDRSNTYMSSTYFDVSFIF